MSNICKIPLGVDGFEVADNDFGPVDDESPVPGIYNPQMEGKAGVALLPWFLRGSKQRVLGVSGGSKGLLSKGGLLQTSEELSQVDGPPESSGVVFLFLIFF